METQAPPINEIVGLLGKFAPRKLTALRLGYPELGPLLQEGVIAGEPGPLTLSLARACVDSLGTASLLCDKGLDGAKKRLTSARTLRFIAGAASALGSGSVLGSIKSGPVGATVAGGVVALVGSIATLGIEFYEKIYSSNKANLLQIYSDLVDCRSDVAESKAEIEAMIANAKDSDAKKLDAAIRSANQTCRKIRSLCSAVGVTAI